ARAGVGLAEEADVGDELENQLEAPLFPLFSRFPFARRLMRRRREVLVAAPAMAASGDEQRRIGLHKLAEDFAGLGVADFGAGRDGEVDVIRGLPRHVFALAVLAPLGAPMGVVAVIEERREVGVDLQIDATTCTAVSPVRAAFRHELFATERRGAGATCAGNDLDDGADYEHGHPPECVNPGLLARGSSKTYHNEVCVRGTRTHPNEVAVRGTRTHPNEVDVGGMLAHRNEVCVRVTRTQTNEGSVHGTRTTEVPSVGNEPRRTAAG